MDWLFNYFVANEYIWLVGGIGFVGYGFVIEVNYPNHRELGQKYATLGVVMLLGSGILYLLSSILDRLD